MSIPFADIKKQYYSIKTEIDDAIMEVLKDTAFIRGKYVDRFEKTFSTMYGIKHCIGVGNGTDAIYLALKALEIGPGDEVITVSNTAIPTVSAIVNVGAIPRFVDTGANSLALTVTSAPKIEDFSPYTTREPSLNLPEFTAIPARDISLTGGSFEFDGTTDFLRLEDSADFNLKSLALFIPQKIN